MTVFLLGATGRTGKLVLLEALNQGYTVNCVVRKQPTSTPPGVKFFIGNPADKNVLEQAIQGCNAIISVLNVSRNSDFPWSKLRTPERLLSEVMNNLIPLARQNNINRIIICSAWGVSETKADIPVWFRWLIDNSNIGSAYADHERQEKLLQQSNLSWTIVRPAALINTNKKQQVIQSYGNQPKPRLTISRLSVAEYLVDCVSNDTLVRKAPVISA
jgi:putative NADH-flavin reductase